MQELNPKEPRGPKVQTMVPQRDTPIFGLIALSIALVANFPWLGFLGFLSILLGLIALFKGQMFTGFLAIATSVFAIVTSYLVWSAGLLYFMSDYMDMPELMPRPSVEVSPGLQRSPEAQPPIRALPPHDIPQEEIVKERAPEPKSVPAPRDPEIIDL